MQESQTPEIKVLSIIHLALLSGQILFALISLYIVYGKGYSPNPSWQSNAQIFMFLTVAIGAAGYLGGSILFKKKLKQINAGIKPVAEKLNEYRAASINRWALMEFPVLFCIILFFVSHDALIIILAGIFIFLFLTLRPSLQKTSSDMGISEIEIQQIGNSSPQ